MIAFIYRVRKCVCVYMLYERVDVARLDMYVCVSVFEKVYVQRSHFTTTARIVRSAGRDVIRLLDVFQW